MIGVKTRLTELIPAQADNLHVRARQVLSLLIMESCETSIALVDPFRCPNCDQPVLTTRSPYCSDPCREMAAFIRQMRHALDTGSIENPDRQVALGQKLWHLLGGGYPLRESLIPNSVIKKVFQRESGKCQACGAPATRIDHTGSG